MSAAHQIMDRLTRLLHDEIAAIGAGKLEMVRTLYAEKAALLAELEEHSERMEDQLEQGGPGADTLRDKLETLHALVRQEQQLLERMADATGRAARELARIRARHGLGGLYDQDGNLIKADVANPQHIDQSI